MLESCQLKGKRVVNPIIDWSDTDIWTYAAAEKIEMNPLYCEGFRRVGCVGCPMAGAAMRKKEFARYPKIKAAYIRAFERMLERRRERGLLCDWQTGVDVYHWWMEDGVITSQTVMSEFEEA